MADEAILKQAERTLLDLECRALYTTRRINLVLRQLISRVHLDVPEFDFEEMVATLADPNVALSIHEIESIAGQYQGIDEENTNLQAALAHQLAAKYPLTRLDVPELGRLLNLDSPGVAAAHQSLFGQPLESMYASRSAPDPRPFWLRFPANVLQEIMPDFAREVEWVFIPSGQVLFNQGDEADSYYAIINGRVRIVVTAESGEEAVRIERGRGEIFGEIAMLTVGQRRTASVIAIRDTELVRVGREGFDRLFLKHPHFGLLITRLIAGSFLESIKTGYRQSLVTTLALLPTQPSVPLDSFVDRLSAALGHHGSVSIVNATQVNEALGEGFCQIPPDHEANGRLVAWLTGIENANRFVILVADTSFTAWTRRCLRTADRTLLVAEASQDPGLSQIEQALQQFQDHRFASTRELILLHSFHRELPKNSDRWLEHRQVARLLHVQADSPQDFARLARILAGKAIGLALSGGGARGMAHIGVIRAIHEAGIPVDAVGGTSFGAIVAAAFALEWEWQQIYETIKAFINHRSKYFRLAIPLVSLLEGRNVSRLFRQQFGMTHIEDLRRTFFCVASNLTHSRPEVLDRGPLWRAVRASMSLPSVFPPVLINREILVDGGIINNLPSDILKAKLEGGPVIASDVGASQPEFYDFEEDVSSWRLLGSRLFRTQTAKGYPSIAKIVNDTMNVANNSQRAVQTAGADLMIRVPVEHFQTFDYEAHPQLVEAGYRAAASALEAWQLEK